MSSILKSLKLFADLSLKVARFFSVSYYVLKLVYLHVKRKLPFRACPAETIADDIVFDEFNI